LRNTKHTGAVKAIRIWFYGAGSELAQTLLSKVLAVERQTRALD